MVSRAKLERPCANCQGDSNLSCKACKLVLYCSAECQKMHWSKHRVDCKSALSNVNWIPFWYLDARKPVLKFQNPPVKFFWGNTPAHDILNLPANEGVDYGKELRLLFAASGDLRNVVKTLVSMPSDCKSKVEMVINDREFDIAARNIILMLVALVVEEDQAAIECMIHLWYSPLIRPSDHSLLTTKIRPLINDIVRKVAHKPESQWLGKTWTIGAATFRVELPKHSWDRLLTYFEVPAGLTAEKASKVRTDVTLAPKKADLRELYTFLKTPAHRVGLVKFREDGIVLPFGASRTEFTVPNPTLFQSTSWLMNDFDDPLRGWHYPEILDVASGPASNDLYGKLYCHVQASLARFRRRLFAQDCMFRMLNLDVTALPEHLAGKDFARIETSNIADRAHLGTESTVSHLGPLLQKPGYNPYATLVTAYLTAVEETRRADPSCPDYESSKVCQYMPKPTDRPSLERSAWMIATRYSLHHMRDVDKHFDRYMTLERFRHAAEASGMEIKQYNTVIEKWPLQLKRGPDQPGAQEELELLRSSGHKGSERYVEWKRA